MRLRRLLALALIAGAAFAAPLPVQEAVRSVVQGSTYEEILQWSDTQFAKQASFGRYVRWGGAIILGSALVYTALDYFYNTLKRQTGTSLDRFKPENLYAAFAVSCRSSSGSADYYWTSYYFSVSGNRWVTVGGASYSSRDLSCPDSTLITNYTQRAKDSLAPYQLPPGSWRQVSSLPPELGAPVWSYNLFMVYSASQSLRDFLRANPDAANGVKTAVSQYLQDTPPGSRSNPYPGVQLDPAPNPNQWTDNPYTDLGTDTDGDGWPDWMEKQTPWPDGINDPNSHPDPNRDDDGDGYTNQEEKQAGTDPYDPNSKPGTNPSTDTDGDGYPDDQELRCGSDPRDPTSKCTNEQPKGDELSWPGAPGTPSLPGLQRPNDPALPQFQTPELQQTPWDQAMDSMRQSIEQLKQQAADKFPFAIVRWLRVPSTSDSGGCPAPQLTIGQWTATVNICNNPVWQAATQLRPFMLGGLVLTFAFTIVRRGLDVQR